MDHRFVYITAGDRDEARAIGRDLVAERLVACVNIIDRMSSIYWWKDEIQEDDEVVVAKTVEDLVPAVVERVKELHSYDVPCVVSLPLVGGNQDFLDWIVAETLERSGTGV